MARQIISACQLQKLDKNDILVFLAIVRANEPPNKRDNKRGKRFQGREAKFSAAHGITEDQKRHINKQTGPKKDFVSVEERDRQVLNSVPEKHNKDLEALIKEFQDIFPEKLAKGVPPPRKVQHVVDTKAGSKPSYRPPYRLGPAEEDELGEQIKDLLDQRFIRPSYSPYGAPILLQKL